MSTIIGAIFPVSQKQADNIFDNGKNVFIKFTRFNQLHQNSKVIFYVSGKKVLVGEGKIETIARLESEAILSRFGGRLFISEAELQAYSMKSPIGNTVRPTRSMLVFELKNLKKYRKKIPMGIITPAGRYITKDEYSQLRKLC